MFGMYLDVVNLKTYRFVLFFTVSESKQTFWESVVKNASLPVKK